MADTFLVLWRRLDQAPSDEEVLFWLYGVIRHVLANRHRTRVRKERLVARLGEIAEQAAETAEVAATRIHARAVLEALQMLGEQDREILLLAAWERLSAAEIGGVLGCSENAAAIRLHRARKRLTEVHRKENERAGHRQSEWPRLRRPSHESQDG